MEATANENKNNELFTELTEEESSTVSGGRWRGGYGYGYGYGGYGGYGGYRSVGYYRPYYGYRRYYRPVAYYYGGYGNCW